MAATPRRSALGRLAAFAALALATAQLLSTAAGFVPSPVRQRSEPGAGMAALPATVGRRSAAASLLGLALSPGPDGQAVAASRRKSIADDDYGDDFSKLDGMLKKDWGAAVEETKCKPWDEGERRAFCVTKEVNDLNRKRAEERGETYTDKKGKLSKGSYGV